MKNTVFARWFKEKEPIIFNELQRLKNKQSLFILTILTITGLAFLIQFFVPIGLKITVSVIAVWLLLLLVTLSILPSFIAAVKVFSKSKIQKRIAVFITFCCVFFVSITYMAFKLIPFFSGGLKLFNES